MVDRPDGDLPVDDTWVTVTEAAEKSGYNRGYVRKLAHKNWKLPEDQRTIRWPIPRSFGVMYAARRPVYDLIENENCVPTREVSQPERQIKVEYSLVLKSAFGSFRATSVHRARAK